jgi:RNA polymerase sigma-70 factor (ECF subfamily)
MINKQTEDRDLILAYVKGNEKAFEILVMRHKNKIHRFIYMKLRDQDLTEDIFQETFIKVINTIKLGSYNEEGKFLPWVLRIAHNLVIDHFRRSARVKMISESSSKTSDFNIFSVLKIEDDSIEQTMMKGELGSQMVELVEFLPANQREVLKMRLFQDLSFQDISEKENISINTALGRMRYALINLRKLIEKHELVIEI